MSFAAQLDKLKEQEWYQQAKSSYDQLSPDQQNYAKWGSLALGAIFFFYLTLSTIGSANTAKEDYFGKQELVQLITSATDEIRRLKGQNAGFSQNTAQNWRSIIQGVAAQQNISADSIEITKEAPGAVQSIIQESLLEVQIKGVSIRPLTQFLVQLEHGNPPVKIKGMHMETSAEGTLNAHLSLSGYLPKPEKGDKSR